MALLYYVLRRKLRHLIIFKSLFTFIKIILKEYAVKPTQHCKATIFQLKKKFKVNYKKKNAEKLFYTMHSIV